MAERKVLLRNADHPSDIDGGNIAVNRTRWHLTYNVRVELALTMVTTAELWLRLVCSPNVGGRVSW